MRYPTRRGDDGSGGWPDSNGGIRQSPLESSIKVEGQGYITSRMRDDSQDALAMLLPFLFVLSTLLFVMILFLVCVLLLRRRRGISLRDSDGPVDVSRDDVFNDADGGLAGVEERWLESLGEDVKRNYRQAKLYEAQYPPNSIATDITLSQFLTIQEKGVSAWSFEPEYEALTPVLVHARTELTFLPDPASCSSVQSNLPIPKLNEVYYWEVKMFDLPTSTNVAVGLATKPFPTFRLPGWNKYSVAYHSNGDKSYNYPFTATPFGPPLREGDVLGVGYRPRTGIVFFTRNGRKTEEAFSGLSRWNLFPTVGADGPCSVHVNLGQAGFVFIEANVKKWGLAPSVGTLAPPPAYGAERGSILLESGGATPNNSGSRSPGGSSGRRQHRHRRPKTPSNANLPPNPSPLRSSAPLSPPPPFSPGEPRNPRQGILDRLSSAPSTSRAVASTSARALETIPAEEEEEGDRASTSSSQRTARNGDGGMNTRVVSGSPEQEPESPYIVNPPTPNVSDIHLRTLERTSVDLGRGRAEHSRTGSRTSATNVLLAPPPHQLSDRQLEEQGEGMVMNRARAANNNSSSGRRESRTSRDSRNSAESGSVSGSEDSVEENAAGQPPGYAVINPHIYASGVHIDLPAEVIQAALDGRPVESSSSGSLNPGRGVRR